MKKISLYVLTGIAMIAGQVKAQDSMRTLFHTPSVKSVGFYVAPEIQYGQINAKPTGIGGLSGMFILNEKFAIGATMQHTLNRELLPRTAASGTTEYLRVNYGGLKMEYTLNPHGLVHLSFPLVLGMGNASYDSLRTNRVMDTTKNRPMMGMRSAGSQFYVIQPGIQVEANLMKYAKFYVGANYRFGIKADNANALSEKYVSGVGVYAGIKIGLFSVNPRFHCKKK